ncbi:MAG: cellobiose phosphorylase, partial [Gemmatimonadota bacterium]
MHRRREPEEPTGEVIGQLARRLARKETVAAGRGRPRRFRRRLHELERSLASLHRRFRESEEMRDLHPRIAEWLLDNAYLTRGALRHVQDTLSPGFLRDLPRLAEAEEPVGRPRIRVLASTLVEDSRTEFDIDDLLRFVHAFQETTYLSLGELWALPPMLQFAVLETLDSVVSALLSPADTVDSTAGDRAAVVALEPVRTVAACIESLRLIDGYDWRTFVETVSRVEAVLRQDPAEVYVRMDPESRDGYRRAVEQIARGCGGYGAETRVAEHAVRRARDASSNGGVARERHVGHHLVDAGREELERELECRPSWKLRRRRWILRHAQPLYLGSVGVATVGALVVLGVIAGSLDMGRMSILLTLVAGVVPAVTMAVSLVNWLAAHLVTPRTLPKLEVKDRVPAGLRTVVALPVLIADRRELEELFSHLEVLRHANPLQGLSFVLLTDLPDAPERTMPGDAELVEMARRGIRELNAASDDARPFSLLHRERLWNAAEGCWMGWERKRGKLEEFNRFLLEVEDTGFVVREGDPESLRGARFVITLDADTILPPEAAGQLIGTLGHPLNRPEIAPDGRITAGYSVLQPRIDVMPRGGNETPFASLGQEADGLDLYSHAASDVHQDLFGEGLYAGKGIYDVHAFHTSLRGRVPENAILSHDLFEGLHGRAGLASDIRVFEEYPAHVEAYLRRFHRWIRGDWQLVPWLGARVPGKDGERLETRFGRLDRWKIFDNLRRSLVAPSLLALLGIGWLTSGAAWIWPALVLGVYALPVFLGAAGSTRRLIRGQRVQPRRHRAAPADLARATWSGSARAIGRWLLALLLLPYEALIALDAIVRTLYRIVVSRRHLLQWKSAAHTSRRVGGPGRVSTWTRLWQGPVVGIAVVLLVAIGRPENLLAAVTFAVVWIVSPPIAGFLSRPRPIRVEEMSVDGRRRLRAVALHTWYYFERLIDSEDNWLPPDNFREDHGGRVARRTSPTNIGMMLGGTQAAFDLGFVDVLLFEATIRNALDSIAKLERYRGHLLNWYSTSDLRSLEPRYVSTVDSGNLAASLLTVSRGLQDAARRQPLGRREVRGLCDSLAAVRLAAHAVCSSTRKLAALDSRLEAAESELRSAESDPRRIFAALRRMDETHVPAVEDALMGLLEAPGSTLDERRMADLRTWARKLRQHVGTLRRLQRRLLPWLALSSHPAAAEIPTALQDALGGAARLCDLPEKIVSIRDSLNHWEKEGAADATRGWRSELRAALDTAAEEAERVLDGLAESSAEMRAMVDEMDFRFLFDPERELFHIGFDVTAEAADPHYYDLLASEARVASLLAIARGDVTPAHWLR